MVTGFTMLNGDQTAGAGPPDYRPMAITNATDWLIRSAHDQGYGVVSGGQIDASATAQKVQLPTGVDSVGSSTLIVPAQDDSATPIDCSALFTAAATDATWALLEVDGSGVGHCTVGSPAPYVPNVSAPEMPPPTPGYVVHAALFAPHGVTAFDPISQPYSANNGKAKIIDKRCFITSGGSGSSSGIIAVMTNSTQGFRLNPTTLQSLLLGATDGGGTTPFGALPSLPAASIIPGAQYRIRASGFIRTLAASTGRWVLTIAGAVWFDWTTPANLAINAPTTNLRMWTLDATLTALAGGSSAAVPNKVSADMRVFADDTPLQTGVQSLYTAGRSGTTTSGTTFDNSAASVIDLKALLGTGNAGSSIGIREFVLSRT